MLIRLIRIILYVLDSDRFRMVYSCGRSFQELLAFVFFSFQVYPVMLNSESFEVLSALQASERGYVVRVRIHGREGSETFLWQLSDDGKGWKTDAVMPDS